MRPEDKDARRTSVKRMSLSVNEFRAGVAALGDDGRSAAPPGDLAVTLPTESGRVTVSYEPLPPVRLGGLLDLPQALVRLSFDGVGADDQTAFERRFWIVFQRGGG